MVSASSSADRDSVTPSLAIGSERFTVHVHGMNEVVAGSDETRFNSLSRIHVNPFSRR
jgi:hypothetical protein